MNILKNICIAQLLLCISACHTQPRGDQNEQNLYDALYAKLPQEKKDAPIIWTLEKSDDGDPPKLAIKKLDTMHPRYQQGMEEIRCSWEPLGRLVEKYENAKSLPLDEVYADAAIVAKAYKAHADNYDWISVEWNICRASYQTVAYTIYPKMKKLYPRLAKINIDYYRQKKQEAQDTKKMDNLALKRIKHMAIVEYATRQWWHNHHDYLRIAYETFFQDGCENSNNVE